MNNIDFLTMKTIKETLKNSLNKVILFFKGLITSI